MKLRLRALSSWRGGFNLKATPRLADVQFPLKFQASKSAPLYGSLDLAKFIHGAVSSGSFCRKAQLFLGAQTSLIFCSLRLNGEIKPSVTLFTVGYFKLVRAALGWPARMQTTEQVNERERESARECEKQKRRQQPGRSQSRAEAAYRLRTWPTCSGFRSGTKGLTDICLSVGSDRIGSDPIRSDGITSNPVRPSGGLVCGLKPI